MTRLLWGAQVDVAAVAVAIPASAGLESVCETRAKRATKPGKSERRQFLLNAISFPNPAKARVRQSKSSAFPAKWLDQLSISKIASGLKCATELIVDRDASGRELRTVSR